MFTFLAILTAVVFICLLLVATVQPERSELSPSELKRRAVRSEGYKAQQKRAELLDDVDVVLRIKTALLLVLTVVLSIATFDWAIGGIVAVFVAVSYPAMARNRGVHHLGQRLYERYEQRILRVVARIQPLTRLLRSGSWNGSRSTRRVDSSEELVEILQNSTDVLTPNQRKLIESAIAFGDKKVESIMTPKAAIDSIRKDEFLGPLVLSELHKLGHSRLPVIDGDIDHVVGTLHLRDLLSLDIKRSVTAEKAMERKVYYIHQQDTLEHALAAFLKVRHHLFVVINDNRETVGLLTIEDVVETLIGRRIVDEDDIHDDLVEVARVRGRTNNSALGHVDL